MYNIEKQMSSHASYTEFNPPPTPNPLALELSRKFSRVSRATGLGKLTLPPKANRHEFPIFCILLSN